MTDQLEDSATEPQTSAEQDMAEPCERRHCTRDVFEDALVPITVGDQHREWCPQCVRDEFGLDYGAYKRRRASAWRRYVTPEAAVAFLLGVLLMFIVASVMVV